MVDFGSLTIDSEQLVSGLKREMKLRDLCRQEIYSHIINLAAQDKGVTVSDDEIQTEADQFHHH